MIQMALFISWEYHLFHQFYPYDSVWGSHALGHAKSKDLLHWEELPVALAPSESYDMMVVSLVLLL